MGTAMLTLLAACGGDGDSSTGGGASSVVTTASANPAPTDDTGSSEVMPTGITPNPDSTATPAPPTPAPTPAVTGPNLNGNWAGYYKSIDGAYEPLTATITHNGNKVTISTSKKMGIVRELSGTIDSIGDMLLYDAFDHQDWTTLYGPASANSINLADYVFTGVVLTDTNILILKR